MPKVSVGMPVFNGGKFLRESVESILGQTYQDLELIISDNASTDNTREICQSYAERDARVRYFRNNENIGASDNYNAVFRYSHGEYFKWASCNDVCDFRFIEECVGVLDGDSDVVLAYPRTRLFYGNTGRAEDYVDGLDLPYTSPCRRFKTFLHRVRLNNVMNGLVRSTVLRRTPLIKPFLSSDVSLMAELTLYGKFAEVPTFMFYRRMDPEAATALKSEEEVFKHYDPNLRRRMLFQNWKINYAYFSSVRRAPLSMDEKVCLFKHVARRAMWDRKRLAGDIYDAIRSLGRRSPASA